MRYDDKDKEKQKPQGFDLQVTHFSEKTGLVERKNPYTLRVRGTEGGEKSRIFERPPGSGNCWDKKGNAIGRFVKGKFVEGEKHVDWAPPESSDQRVAREAAEAKAENVALKAELAAYKAEKERLSGKGSKTPQGS